MTLKKAFTLIIATLLISSMATASAPSPCVKVDLSISGKITGITKQADKWFGQANFTGKTKDGTRYTGKGNVVITFTDSSRKTIKLITGQLKGTKGTEDYIGVWSTKTQINITGTESVLEIAGIDGECN